MRKSILGYLLLGGTLIAVAPSLAQADWPSKPIKIIVPYPPGGNVDAAARIVALDLSKAVGQTVVIDNKAGASGLIAGDFVARAEPDGHTLFMTANGPLLYAPVIYNRPLYNWQKSFTLVGMVSLSPLLVQVHPAVPAKTVPELLALIKAKPDEYRMTSSGAGTTNHLMSELIQKRTGVTWTTVHYKGGAPSTLSLLSGETQFGVDQLSIALPNIRAGKTRALAVISSTRLPWLPDVPTMQEQGITGVEGQTFTGLLAPANTPQPIIQKLGNALKAILEKQDIKERFYAGGAEAHWMAPTEFSAYLQKEEATWTPIIKSANIKAD